jgi:hypothetical protein
MLRWYIGDKRCKHLLFISVNYEQYVDELLKNRQLSEGERVTLISDLRESPDRMKFMAKKLSQLDITDSNIVPNEVARDLLKEDVCRKSQIGSPLGDKCVFLAAC